MEQLLDGTLVAEKIKQRVEKKMHTYGNPQITLGILAVGTDEASRLYRNRQKKDCAQYGLGYLEAVLEETCSPEAVVNLLKEWNENPEIHGILVQLPLPASMDQDWVLSQISPWKDVDGIHPANMGKLALGQKDGFPPCTPAGVMDLLAAYEIPLEGKSCVVVGRSNIVGKPMGLLLLSKNATVTICHSKTENLSSHTKQADILVVAVGKQQFLKEDMVKQGAVVVDVGIHWTPQGIVGDVDFSKVKDKAKYITPVPGGVGVVTRGKLMEHTVDAYGMQKGKR